jgi:hypothetical protein
MRSPRSGDQPYAGTSADIAEGHGDGCPPTLAKLPRTLLPTVDDQEPLALAAAALTKGGEMLAFSSEAVNFLRDAFAQLEVIAFTPGAAALFDTGGLSQEGDPGVMVLTAKTVDTFIRTASAGRIWNREPKVRLLV